MTFPTPCPDPSSWRGLLEGSLPAAQQGPLAAHLESCPRCRQALGGLAAGKDSWTEVARHLTRQGPGQAAAPARAAGQGDLAETQAESAPAGGPPLDFLDPSPVPGHLGRLGPYEVLGEVGRGGMGVVLRA